METFHAMLDVWSPESCLLEPRAASGQRSFKRTTIHKETMVSFERKKGGQNVARPFAGYV